MRVRIVTLNLQGLANAWFERRSAAVIQGLSLLAPDVVCLQEVTVRYAGRRYHQAEALGEAIGLPAVAFHAYGALSGIDGAFQHGLAIASRWPLRRVRDRRLPDGHDPRIVLLATLLAPGGELEVLTTHLAWRIQDIGVRHRGATLLSEELTALGARKPRSRLLLAGDFNATEDEPVIELLKAGLQDTFRVRHPHEPGFTWLKTNPYNAGFDAPDRRLDYIFCPHGVVIRDARVVLTEAAPVCPSDHFGVMADLEWPER